MTLVKVGNSYSFATLGRYSENGTIGKCMCIALLGRIIFSPSWKYLPPVKPDGDRPTEIRRAFQQLNQRFKLLEAAIDHLLGNI